MKRTFVTLLSTSNYFDGVRVLNKSLKRYSDIPLLCLCSQTISDDCIRALEEIGIQCCKLSKSVLDMANVTNLVPGTCSHWQYTFDKLFIWELTQYDKIVFLDADMLICGQIDELFDYPDISAVQSDRVMHPDWIHLNSGMMVVTPSEEVFKQLINNVVPTIMRDKWQQVGVGDQNVIIYSFSNWSEEKDKQLPFSYNLYFNDITYYMKRFSQLYGSPKIIHFASTGKPWFRQSLKINIGVMISLLLHNILAIKYYLRYKMYLGRFM